MIGTHGGGALGRPPPVKVVRRAGSWRLQEPDGTLLPKKYPTRTDAARAARGRNAAVEGRLRR